MDKDAYIKVLEQKLLEAVYCLEDIAHDRWHWAWEEVIAEARVLVDTKDYEHLLPRS